MVIKSYSKINLTLSVGHKKKDLHEIQSYFCLIDLADKIKLKKIKAKKDKTILKGPFANLVNKSNNSILDILKFLRKLKIISDYYSVTVEKNIPVFAGLGGGTGNAAFIFKHIVKQKTNKSLLSRIEDKIGSDFKLFFYKQGFLSNSHLIIDLKKKQKMFFLLIQPDIKCSTKEIYSGVRNYSNKKAFEKKILTSKPNLISFLSESSNDLQSIVENKYPVVKELLINIKNEKGCYFSRITGSGSVCYGLFNNQINAKKALNNLKIKYPEFWSSVAKTV
tara:strand:- start:20 stop:853 length:834 start_codon:yes stop_codon:yes gene_type:complete